MGKEPPLAASPVLIQQAFTTSRRSAEPGSPVADRATRRCFHAAINGSISAHCSSDKSPGYGVRSMPRLHHAHDTAPARTRDTHTNGRHQTI
ncbi:MAG: hypothetical protein QOF84_2546 [Streptomyces sp.]|jgi:hypothetical protein|nr:hypothetical protein [Streptomyces sp.]